MIGTFVNMATILIGSLLGGLVKRIISEKINACLYNAMGLAAFGLGINAVVQNMPDTRTISAAIPLYRLGMRIMINMIRCFQNIMHLYLGADGKCF